MDGAINKIANAKTKSTTEFSTTIVMHIFPKLAGTSKGTNQF